MIRPLAISIFCATLGGTALAKQDAIEFDLGGNFFNGSVATDLGTFSAGAQHAGADILAIEWTDLSLITFNNVGLPYYGSEAMIGLTARDDAGDEASFLFFPFPNANYQGTPEAPITESGTQSLDVTAFGLNLDANGAIDAMLMAAWDDQTGQDAGFWQSGRVRVIFQQIPAPGALGLLGLAASYSGRRRRR